MRRHGTHTTRPTLPVFKGAAFLGRVRVGPPHRPSLPARLGEDGRAGTTTGTRMTDQQQTIDDLRQRVTELERQLYDAHEQRLDLAADALAGMADAIWRTLLARAGDDFYLQVRREMLNDAAEDGLS